MIIKTKTMITITIMNIIISHNKIIKTKNLQGEEETIKTSIILVLCLKYQNIILGINQPRCF